VVIRHGKVVETTCSRLFDQRQWLKAPIAALGVAVKITDIRAAVWADLPEDLPKRMRINRHSTGLSSTSFSIDQSSAINFITRASEWMTERCSKQDQYQPEMNTRQQSFSDLKLTI